jgi:hypothetical protein
LVALPPATQLAGPTQVTVRRFETPAGVAWAFQFEPPFVVCKMFAPPTAVQVVASTHETEDSAVEPSGSPRFFHWAPPFPVESTVEPTARQLESLEQEIPLRAATPEGTVSCDQVVPPFVVLMMAGPLDVAPSATQVEASGHVIAARSTMSPGMTSGDHEDPPFVVPTMLGD